VRTKRERSKRSAVAGTQLPCEEDRRKDRCCRPSKGLAGRKGPGKAASICPRRSRRPAKKAIEELAEGSGCRGVRQGPERAGDS